MVSGQGAEGWVKSRTQKSRLGASERWPHGDEVVDVPAQRVKQRREMRESVEGKRLKRGFKVCACKGGYLAVQSDDTW